MIEIVKEDNAILFWGKEEPFSVLFKLDGPNEIDDHNVCGIRENHDVDYDIDPDASPFVVNAWMLMNDSMKIIPDENLNFILNQLNSDLLEDYKKFRLRKDVLLIAL